MSESTFQGFEPANTTPVPDFLFDSLLTELSGAELKVILYIIRRTWGFKKETDAISFNQFTDGITTKEGKVLDKGCGIKNRTVLSKALATLEKKGYISSTKANDPHGDKATTLYGIRFRSVPGVVSKPYYPTQVGSIETVPRVVSKPYYGSIETVPRVVSKPYLQETVLQETVLQETVLQETVIPLSADADSTHVSENENDTHSQLSTPSEDKQADSVEKPAPKPKKTVVPAGPLVIPPDDAKWCAETAVEIVEYKKGHRYSEVTRKQELAKAALALRYRIDDHPITRSEFELAWEEICSWSLWAEKKLEPMIKHLLKDDRIVTLLQRRTKAASGAVLNGSSGTKPRPTALVSEEQSAYNKAAMYARAEAKRAELIRQGKPVPAEPNVSPEQQAIFDERRARLQAIQAKRASGE